MCTGKPKVPLLVDCGGWDYRGRIEHRGGVRGGRFVGLRVEALPLVKGLAGQALCELQSQHRNALGSCDGFCARNPKAALDIAGHFIDRL